MTAPLRISALSAALGLAAGAAAADLTAPQVWADWQASVADSGQTLSVGSEERAGGILTLRDVSLTADGPQGGLNGTIAEVVMTERGDGSVSIALSPEIPLDFTAIGADGEQADFSVLVDASALDLVASGAPGAVSYVYSAPTMTVTLAEATANGERMDLDMALALAGLDGSYAVTEGAARQVDSALRASSLTVAVKGTDPEGSGDTFDMSMSMADLASQSSGTMSPLVGMTNLTEMIEAGLSTSGTTTHGPATVALAGTSDGSAFALNGGYQSGTYDVALGADGLDYGYTGRDFTLAVSGDQIPFPELSLRAEEIGSRFAMPIGVSDEPQDMGVVLRLIDFSLSDQIWSMFDPGAVLPRDPATLIIDIGGKANWLVDIFDPAVANEPMDAAPGEVHEVSVNELRLALAGAELTGSGDFTVNNEAFIPQPSGTLNLQLVGGNALIDNLIRMGMLPEDQAMGARMMLGLFARPGGGADTLVSEITVQPDGAILANGQRIR